MAFYIYENGGNKLETRRSIFSPNGEIGKLGAEYSEFYADNVSKAAGGVGYLAGFPIDDADREFFDPLKKGAVFAGQMLSIAFFGVLGSSYDIGTNAPGNYQNTNTDGSINREGYSREVSNLSGLTVQAKKSIYLYIPDNLAVSYGFSYADADFTTFSAVQQVLSGTKSGNLDPNTAAEVARQAGTIGLKVIESAGEMLGIYNLNTQKVIEAGTRTVVNPFIEHTFEGTSRRKFTYSFVFTPRSEKESDEVFNIIHTFKRFAHPTRSDAGRYLNYPAEFEIVYMSKTVENTYLNKLARCALEGINIDYSGEDGSFSAFRKKATGAPPTTIKLTLNFVELEILTRERIDQGF